MDWLRIPCIGADPAYVQDEKRAAEWTLTQLTQPRFGSGLIETASHPMVYAETEPIPDTPAARVYVQ